MCELSCMAQTSENCNLFDEKQEPEIRRNPKLQTPFIVLDFAWFTLLQLPLWTSEEWNKRALLLPTECKYQHFEVKLHFSALMRCVNGSSSAVYASSPFWLILFSHRKARSVHLELWDDDNDADDDEPEAKQTRWWGAFALIGIVSIKNFVTQFLCAAIIHHLLLSLVSAPHLQYNSFQCQLSIDRHPPLLNHLSSVCIRTPSPCSRQRRQRHRQWSVLFICHFMISSTSHNSTFRLTGFPGGIRYCEYIVFGCDPFEPYQLYWKWFQLNDEHEWIERERKRKRGRWEGGNKKRQIQMFVSNVLIIAAANECRFGLTAIASCCYYQ